MGQDVTLGSNEEYYGTPSVIVDALNTLSNEYENIIFEMEGIVDHYWIAWRQKNNELKAMRMRSTTSVYVEGSIAPHIVMRHGKAYAEWQIFNPGRTGKKSRRWGKRINPKRNKVTKTVFYRDEQFQNIAKDWEFELILKAESQLSPLRYSAEYIYKARSDIQQLLKSIVRKGDNK
ncbi:hypothetical protein GLP21_12470 [Photobacterium carnosum]|uniref:Uncharacterized protein n=1 Tax=Photobacterium carnosum TaxID=2023717 RepID=A0A2N4UW85_9GAMM|nr:MULTISPECIES: conjugative transfer protein MobI(A/C) [Photobacterium]MCD9475881.1 hypothetical protein [Photobacterium phosphoreum]MCD9507743.1 hypothetical protein [Photobacterium phosphoreum]MCD9538135.1 hypothetical protein [Photobacterium carnosum]MCD9542577.1 hypothetical protein [Photobacterium carnosum]MCD9545963.1 hypothetical protein [Photobacterium carnosum]